MSGALIYGVLISEYTSHAISQAFACDMTHLTTKNIGL